MEILSSLLCSVLTLPIAMLCFLRDRLPSISTHNQFTPLAEEPDNDTPPTLADDDNISRNEESRNPAAVDNFNRPHSQSLGAALILSFSKNISCFKSKLLSLFSSPTHNHLNSATRDSISATPSQDTPRRLASEVSRTPTVAAAAALANKKKWNFNEEPSQVIYPGIKYGYDISKDSSN